MKVSAFAKLNLTLEVLGRRDDGYHEVRTVIQAIDLADQLEIDPNPDCGPGLVVECDNRSLNGEANLVWRGATALAQRCGLPPKAHIYIEKNIPVGMGLGGGSSDAAAALLALNRLWQLNLPLDELSRIGMTLGSDVPFFLQGGVALARGRGDVIEPIEPIEPMPAKSGQGVTLVCPKATLENKTPRLYAELTPSDYSNGDITRKMVENLKAGRCAAALRYNVFEAAAFRMFPNLEELYRLVERVTGRRPHLSGSGPALYCLASGEEEHFRLAKALQPHGAKAYFVHTLDRPDGWPYRPHW